MGRLERDLLVSSQVLEGRWMVRAKLGGGGFGQVYRAMDTKNEREVAIKVEPKGKKEVLFIEAAVFTDLKGRPHTPGFYGFGGNATINFLVMDVLGKNISELRREAPGTRATFSKRTTFLLTLQGLEAIHDFHKAGHLHRDIKPSNYVMGLPSSPHKRTLFLIDFGLARPLWDKHGGLRPARPPGGFRGTVKYASPAAHEGIDLGRKDDLYSLFYMCLEMGRGSLPWRRLKEKADVGRAKKRAKIETLLDDLPPKLGRFGHDLARLEYASEPNYASLISLISEILSDVGGTRDSIFDWDENWITLQKEQADDPRPSLLRKASLPAFTITNTNAATGTNDAQDLPVAPSPSTKRSILKSTKSPKSSFFLKSNKKGPGAK